MSMSAYVQTLQRSAEAERARHEDAREEKARAAAQAARQRLIPLDVRLAKLLAEIPFEVQGEGLSLETIRRRLRGVGGRGAQAGQVADALRRMSYTRSRCWRGGRQRASTGAFSALWYPPSRTVQA
ncbi:MAG: hypothetical protein CTY15_01305 [Methylocystis sp.]|nr:MAG: hypothetical protein CTY15_01305 [Methylocystis sp.]